MSILYSPHRSGVGNPYVEVLSPDFLINADGLEVKRTKAHPCEAAIMRFLSKVQVSEVLFYNNTPCWEWKGCITPKTGYGQFRFDGRRGSSLSNPHRFSYCYFIGDVPEGYEVDHLCKVRHCCSPLHLEAVTVQENRKRRNASQTHCKNGHEFTPENTRIGKRGERRCRACNREKMRAFYARNPGYNKIMNFPCRQ